MVPVSEVGRETGGCIDQGVWKGRQPDSSVGHERVMTHGPVGN